MRTLKRQISTVPRSRVYRIFLHTVADFKFESSSFKQEVYLTPAKLHQNSRLTLETLYYSRLMPNFSIISDALYTLNYTAILSIPRDFLLLEERKSVSWKR